MKSVFISPRKYVQGRDVLRETGTYVAMLGKRPMVLWDKGVKAVVGATVLASLKDAGLDVTDVEFGGESTREEVARVAQRMRAQQGDVAIGVGGGKTLDTAKAVAVETGAKMVMIPTIASNDSPTSAASMWYDAQGNCTGYSLWPFNPDIVLVDSAVIARAPVRAFVAGMGDALATWVEAEAAFRSRAVSLAGGVSTLAAMAIARLCYTTLLDYGIEAKRAVEQKVVTPAVEKCVEANVLLSGLGFESGGLATAHMIANALPSLPECKKFMHGEKVGFGIISQRCLDEDADVEETYKIVDFEIAIGLPVTFADLNLEGISRERLKLIGDACAGKGSLCESHCFEVTSDSVIDAMIAADALGRHRKALAGACCCC
jgi:glycerol dehydrogenase